jgi:hypothetical protein
VFLNAFKKNWQIITGIGGLFAIFCGFIFYVFVRGQMGFFTFGEMAGPQKGIAWGSIPSFLHALALTFISVSFGLTPKRALILTLAICVSFELAQGVFPVFGTFDVLDLVSVFVGGFFAFIAIRQFTINLKDGLFRRQGIIITFGVLTCVATSKSPKDIKDINAQNQRSRMNFTPVYMSYESLRSSYAVGAPRKIGKIGKEAQDGSLLFISESAIGIHIFENSNPSNPVPLHFISVPGNMDVTVKSGVLYVDSFVDLLAIQVEGAKPPVLIKRLENVFEWDPYQGISDQSVTFDKSDIDSQRGVIIGFEKHLTKDNSLEKNDER